MDEIRGATGDSAMACRLYIDTRLFSGKRDTRCLKKEGCLFEASPANTRPKSKGPGLGNPGVLQFSRKNRNIKETPKNYIKLL